jgi:hypothetical protein
MPIMRMDDIGMNQPSDNCGGTTEENVAAQVVRIIVASFAVNTRAGKKVWMVNEI